ncbi:DUF6351 family protein (plasmid) [Pseudoalteromonas sp. T1lg65]|uniref:DUF6351 family protein n=1 Tax=Pseudoalteromonas sp. T1lg65 TaxID=2077101 RepID=UPI003F796D5C
MTYRVISILIVATISIALWLWLSPQDENKRYAVQQVAKSEYNLTLNFYPHISKVQRPQDPFPFPIKIGQVGPTQNLYSGPNQYPFYCMTRESGLGQPVVDNQDGDGVAVYAGEQIIGYSKDCSTPTRIDYYYQNDAGQVVKASSTESLRRLIRNMTPELIFRVEQGTINRFIYTLVMPIAANEIGDRLAQSQWNKRLIYQFNGGSGIGYRQGRQSAKRVITRQLEQLQHGYAVISSSGNKTSYTYNMLLAEDTARRVKKQFTSLYGEPLYTVGVGGSGGGLAQYLIAQNSTGILDGLIPLYSYPDMVTQTTYALDCDLLNNYFTFRADDKKAWHDWTRRRHLEGMNAVNDFPQRAGFLQPLNQLMAGFVPSFPDGNSECINGYFGLSTFINNPRQGFLRAFFTEPVVEQTHWSYWQDMQHVFGTDQHGMGLSTWDNVGVQYGLEALKQQQITIDEFLDINKKVGSWKPQQQMQQEEIALPFGNKLPLWLTLWGNHNITEPVDGVAPRHEGSIQAMRQAYRSGQVFIGTVDLPIIDARHYLENELDMHHMSASFYSRLRLQQANGHSNNHVIWVAHKDYNPTQLAFEAMDQWLMNLNNNPTLTVSEAKPQMLTDTCFNNLGEVIAAGAKVYDGAWNKQPQGLCSASYPMFSTSRIQAGGNWSGDIFKCQLTSVQDAIEMGMYGEIDMSPYLEELKNAFPDGVCDYTQPDQGKPVDLFSYTWTDHSR